MFKSLLGPKKPKYDPTLGDPLGKVIFIEAIRGKIDTLLREVEPLRSGEWDRRAFYVDLAGQYLANPQRLESLPETPLTNLVKGAAAIELAWKARGGGRGHTVSQEGWREFFKHLDYAGKQFVRAAEQDSNDPTGLAFLQTVAMGMQRDREKARGWFDEAVQRDPTNQQAHYRHLFVLLKKWGGSHDEMYAFARSTMEKTSTSSTLYPILYLAFQEHYLYLRSFDENVQGAKAFLQDKSVREESLRIYSSSLQKRTSIERVSDYWPHNVAAWWFMMLNMPDIVREETKKIGPYFTKYPWRIFYKDPADGYQKALRM